MTQDAGRALIVLGVVLVVVGLVVAFADRIPYLGRLPGDIVVKKRGFTLYFPLMTALLVSLVFTLLLNLWSRR
jgi:hypothetical protein